MKRLVLTHTKSVPLVETDPRKSLTLWKRFQRLSEYQRNARTEDYMIQVAQEQSVGEGKWGDVSEFDRNQIQDAEEIVLIWRDANGLGWGREEMRLWLQKNSKTPIKVLNGRDRFFLLNPATWLGYLIRRFIERSYLGEAGLAFLLIASFPFLFIWDFGRGHR